MENGRSHDRLKLNPVSAVSLVILMAALAACATPTQSPEERQFWATYAADRQTAAAVQATDKANFATKYPLRTPTPPPPPKPVDSSIICGTVEFGGSIEQAIGDANHGNLPPAHDKYGNDMVTQIDHKVASTGSNSRATVIWENILENVNVPTVAQGDRVCVSANTHMLNQVPIPTPGPYRTPTPQANNLQSRSYAVTVNKQPIYRRHT